MLWDLTDGESTLVQVMAWCHQAISHYLNQCWPSLVLPYGITRPQWVNTLRQEQNGCHFADNIFKCILLNENFYILFETSLDFVPEDPIHNNSALVQLMACCRMGNKILNSVLNLVSKSICLTSFEALRPEGPKKFLLNKSLKVVIGPKWQVNNTGQIFHGPTGPM